MSKITRRAVLAGVPVIAASSPAADTPTAPSMDLRPSDPALAARWRYLVARLVELEALEEAADRLEDAAQEHRVALLMDACWADLHAFEAQLWASPVRAIGDVVLRAEVARYWGHRQFRHSTPKEFPSGSG